MTEIAIVLSVILLVGLLAPNFIRHGCRGQLTACKSNLKNIGTALEMYSTDWNGHYPRNLNLLTPNYLKTIPECPNAGRVTYRADFGPQAGYNNRRFQDYYVVECAGNNHRGASVPPDYPQYDAVNGLIGR